MTNGFDPTASGGWSDLAARFDFTRPDETGTDPTTFPTRVQPWRNTQFDRFPEIFLAVSNLTLARHDAGFKVLSYGCSTGEEVRTLAERYFHGCRIVGLDIWEPAIEAARLQSSDSHNVVYDVSTDDALDRHGPYDAIFAMSVLCRWPETKDMRSIHALFPFEHFEERIAALDRSLQPGGFLVIANANYNFFDTASSRGYDVVLSPRIVTNGYVSHFDRRGQAGPMAATDCIYRKWDQPPETGAGRVIRVLDEAGRQVGCIGLSV